MSGFDQRDSTRKHPSFNENAIPLNNRVLADAFQASPPCTEERAIYLSRQGEELLRDTSFCDSITRAITHHGSPAESRALMAIAEKGAEGLHAIRALIQNPEPIDGRLHESGFYEKNRASNSAEARYEFVATRLTHLVYHLESTSRCLSPNESKVAADILVDVSANSLFERAKRHALRVLPTVMRRQGRDYEDPVAHERTRGGGLPG